MKNSIFKYKLEIILIFTIFILYFQSIGFGLTGLDDIVLIKESIILSSSINKITKSFTYPIFFSTQENKFFYRPILSLSFELDTLLGGTNPAIYHLSNIIYHSIASTILLYLLSSVFKTSKKFAFLSSLIFAVHPANTMSVAWIPGRNDIILAIFFMLTIVFLIKDKKQLYTICFTLTIFSKETGILLIPLTIYFLTFIRIGRKRLKTDLLKLIPTWIVIVMFWAYLRNLTISSNNILSLETVSIIINNINGLFLYFGKIFLPINLSTIPILYGIPIIGICVSLIFIFICVFFGIKNFNIFIFGLLIYLGFLLPSLLRSIYPCTQEFLEHRQYLPFIGLIISISQLKIKTDKINSKLVKYAMTILVASLFVVNFLYTKNFSNPTTFWNKTNIDMLNCR